jgi:hypothetical protein
VYQATWEQILLELASYWDGSLLPPWQAVTGPRNLSEEHYTHQAKPDKTFHRYKPLTPEMENAIDLLVTGKPDREVAEAVGVSRQTIAQWRQHPMFMAELNQRRQTLWADAHARLRALIGGAVDVIEDALRNGDLKAAIEVLKAVKLYGEVGAPTGATEPDIIVRQQAVAQLEREGTPRNALAMVQNLDTAAYRARLAEVEHEIRAPYLSRRAFMTGLHPRLSHHGQP